MNKAIPSTAPQAAAVETTTSVGNGLGAPFPTAASIKAKSAKAAAPVARKAVAAPRAPKAAASVAAAVASSPAVVNAAPKAKPAALKAGVPKAAASKALAPKAAAKAAPAAAKAPRKAAAKPATKSATKPAAKAEVAPAKDKARKPKLVRDSFTMPEAEYAVLGQVKKACLKSGFDIKKSELLRIGVALISQIDLATLQSVLAGLPQLKTGRPKKD